MPQQLLVNVLTVTVPAGAYGYSVAHGLRSNDQPATPTLILPAAQSVVTLVGADAENVYLSNPSGGDVTVTLRCERGLSNELDAETITPFFQSVGTGEAPVQSVGVVAPIVNTGTASNPVIGLGALSPSPAGTYGSSSAVPVVTVNSRGQVTGVTTQPVTGGGVAAVSVTAPIVNTGTATNPNIGLGTLSPSPAGTYGSTVSYPVVTVNASGQVTGVSVQNAPAIKVDTTLASVASSGTIPSLANPVFSLIQNVSVSIRPDIVSTLQLSPIGLFYLKSANVCTAQVSIWFAGALIAARRTYYIPAGGLVNVGSIVDNRVFTSGVSGPQVGLEIRLLSGLNLDYYVQNQQLILIS